MKKLLLIFSLVLFSFNANARDIGTLYKSCKVYQSNGFDLKSMHNNQHISSITCFMYFRALADAGTRNCILLQSIDKNYKKTVSPKVLYGFSKFTANGDIISGDGIVRVITSFINFSENNTHYWKDVAPTFSDSFLSNNFPCNLNE